MSFHLNPKQLEAMAVLGSQARFIMGEGGSRSGKTFLILRAIVYRALKAPESRHLIGRLRFNAVKASILHQTFPVVMRKCFPEHTYHVNKQDWFVSFSNGAEIWLAGFDDNERMEKILGNEYCLDPNARVLTADLTWEKAVDLQLGQEIVAFPEELNGHLKLQRASVTRVGKITALRYRIVTDRGETIVSAKHLFVTRGDDRRRRNASRISWKAADRIKVGDQIKFACKPWSVGISRDDGWLAGIIDGEGWLNWQGRSVGVAQNPGLVLSHLETLLRERGIEFRRHDSREGCVKLATAGLFASMRLLGIARPERLMPLAAKLWDGCRGFSRKGNQHHLATVIAVEPLGMGEVVSLGTSTKTLIADGFLGHNSSIYGNEASQLKWSHMEILITRLAQVTEQIFYNRAGEEIGRKPLEQRFYIDLNPPLESHWAYRLFHQHRSPEPPFDPLPDPENYRYFQINPKDNAENLDPKFLASIERLPARARQRFWAGQWGSATENALWTQEGLEWVRVDRHPDLQRIVVAIDPSGTKGGEEDDRTDQVGIVVVGLGTDGKAYVLEDLTAHIGPSTWGRVAVEAYMRHEADVIVAETNFGGAMVGDVIRKAAADLQIRPNFREVTASRGKVVRAEPIATLYGNYDRDNFVATKVHHVGQFPALEDQLCNFTTAGYMGDRSPDRADALIWALAELFPGMTRKVPKSGNIKVEGVSSYNPQNF